jgi:regulator of replication initiation timing
MAAAEMPDLDAMLAELDQLEREERDLSTLRRKLHDRLASFPNPLNEARERQMSSQRRQLHRRIDSLRLQLRNAGFHVGPPGPRCRD